MFSVECFNLTGCLIVTLQLQTYPPPSMDLVTMPTKNGRRRALVIMAAANCNVFVYQIGEQSNENAGMSTVCLATQGGRGSQPQYSTSRRNACVTCVKIAEEAYDRPQCRLFATTDNGKVRIMWDNYVFIHSLLQSFEFENFVMHTVSKKGH